MEHEVDTSQPTAADELPLTAEGNAADRQAKAREPESDLEEGQHHGDVSSHFGGHREASPDDDAGSLRIGKRKSSTAQSQEQQHNYSRENGEVGYGQSLNRETSKDDYGRDLAKDVEVDSSSGGSDAKPSKASHVGGSRAGLDSGLVSLLLVANITPEVTEEVLREEFSKHGTVSNVWRDPAYLYGTDPFPLFHLANVVFLFVYFSVFPLSFLFQPLSFSARTPRRNRQKSP